MDAVTAGRACRGAQHGRAAAPIRLVRVPSDPDVRNDYGLRPTALAGGRCYAPANARSDQPCPRHGHRPGRELRGRARDPADRGIDQHQVDPRRGRAVGRDGGLRRPRARRRRLGLRRQPPPVHRRGGPRRRRGRADREGQRDGPAQPRACSTGARRPTAGSRRRSRRTRSRCRSIARSPTCWRPTGR